MRSIAPVVVCCAALLLAALEISPAAAAEAPGRVTDVTLYRGQALVTRLIPIEGPAGSQEVVVGNLPEQIVPDSLFAEGNDGIEIRAVRFRTRAVGEQPREEVRKLDEAMEKVQEDIQAVVKAQELLTKRSAYLDKLEQFVAPTAKMDLSKGVLNAESLEQITKFSFAQRDEIAEQQLALQKQTKDLQKQMTLLQRKRAELTAGASKTVREAVLFLQKHAAAKGAVRLNYLVSACGWSPTYTFRAKTDGKEIAAECNALIQQMTGEDWKDVALTLSTASPALSAAGPGLAPFPVSLTKGAQTKVSGQELVNQLAQIRTTQIAALKLNFSAMNLSDNIRSSWTANSAANHWQYLELANGKEVLAMMADSAGDNGPSLSYQLASKVSLASRSDQQMVRILQADFQSAFYHVATPVLTSYVYREAELKNTCDKDLLAGPITVYLDGRFVGRSEIPTVARGQTFVVGFGADPQLRARRELAQRKEGVQGGNRELNFKYRLVIENYKDEAATVRVFDRLPHSERPADIRITLEDMKDPLSKDKFYLRTERPKGVLRWDIEVAAAATGDKVRIVEYGYTLDFDRTFALRTIGGPGQADEGIAAPAAAEAMQEFEQQQRARLAQ